MLPVLAFVLLLPYVAQGAAVESSVLDTSGSSVPILRRAPGTRHDRGGSWAKMQREALEAKYGLRTVMERRDVGVNMCVCSFFSLFTLIYSRNTVYPTKTRTQGGLVAPSPS